MRWAAVMGLCVACGGATGGDTAGGTGGEEQASSSGEAGSTAPGETTEGLDSSSGEPDEDESCFDEEWSWSAELSSSHAVAIAHGEKTALLDTGGGRVRLSAFDADGSLVFEPELVGNGYRGDVAAGPNDEWWLVTRADDGDHLLRRSSQGVALADHLVTPTNEPGGLWSIAVTPNGNAVLGGSVPDKTSGQTRLLGVDDDGTVQWEYDGFDDTVHEIEIDPDGTIFAMTIAVGIEGGDVSVLSLEPDGTFVWSFLAGSHGGFGDERMSPFGLGLDGNGGFVTVGAEPGARIRVAPWHTPNVLTERYDGAAQREWRTEAALTGTDALPMAGAVTRVGELGFVAVVNGSMPTLVLLDLDGTPRCQRRLSEELSIGSVVATSGDTVVVAGGKRDESGSSRTWVAQFRAFADR